VRGSVPGFPSAAWAREFQVRLNENAAYAAAAAVWEGDILFLIAPDENHPEGEGIYLDLFHGRCREARFVEKPSTVNAEFVYRGTREGRPRVLRRQVDPFKALIDGTLELEGNLAKAMRFTRAAKEMVETASEIPLDVG
jgi:putative sterol carrier protein